MASPMDLCDDIRGVLALVPKRTTGSEVDPVDEFFDMKLYEQQYALSVTDTSVTTDPSAADSSSENTRPTTVGNSEVHSNAASNDPSQDEMMQETGVSDHDGTHMSSPHPGPESPLLFPELIDDHKRRAVVKIPQKLPNRLPGSRTLAPKPGGPPAAVTSWGNGSLSPLEPSQRGPSRTRKVDRDRTKKNRDKKACIHCRIQKRTCDDKDLCARCFDWDPAHHDRVCTRDRLDDILRSGQGSILGGGRWAKGPSNQRNLNDGSRVGQTHQVIVFFSPSDKHGLHIVVATHRDTHRDIDARMIGDCSILQREILDWTGRELEKRSPCDFRRSVDAFLYLYSKRDCVEKKPLVDSVVRMASMWRLLSAPELYFAERATCRTDRLPLVVTQLKDYARRELHSAEEKVMKEICALVPDAFTADDDSDCPAVWAALWSVILLYRQALQLAGTNSLPSIAAAPNVGALGSQPFKDGFKETTGKLVDTLVVILSGHLRTRRVLEALDKPNQPSFCHLDDVRAAYVQARRERGDFYAEVRASKSQLDELLDMHVVESEQKVLGRKKQKGGKQNEAVELFCPY